MNTARRPIARAAARPWHWLWLALGTLLLLVGAAAVRPAAAQDAAPLGTVSDAALADIVGPIALYPDDLVAIVLPASTYPLQIVEAARFLEERERNPNLTPDEDWDESIVALLNYPEVVATLNDDLDWLYDLGTAVLNQRADVLDAIQGFRDRAYAAGNLRSDDRQTVTRADATIEIKPANPQVIYVPYYEPERVVIYQTVPVYHYYPRRYPVYYYPYPASYVFDTGFFFGVRSWFSLGWHSHHVHVYDWGYRGHPYYGWSYYDPWYVRNAYINVHVHRDRVWEPRYRYGGRPVVRGYEGRVYTADEPARVSRGVAGSAVRGSEGRVVPRAGGQVGRSDGGAGARSRSSEARVAPSAGGQVSRGVAGSAYRYRSAESTERARAAAEASRPTAIERSPTIVRPQPSTAYRGNASSGAVTRDRAYRSGGGLSQAVERSRVSAPRDIGGSTGMPRQAPRAAPSQAPVRAAPSASAEPRGGSYRSGNAGGGERQQPARGGNSRSAAR